jgi:RNA polymerase sigma factor (sigma-70 family)
MAESLTTRPSLLIRIRDASDDEAWSLFVHLYAPLVYNYGRRHGLQDSDAADLAQDVLQAVITGVSRLDYDPARGSFRGWLCTLAHRKLCDLLDRQRRAVQGQGDTAVQELLQQQPAPEEDAWEQEYEQRLFAWAVEKARGCFEDSTWQAFWQTAVEGKAAAEVAATLGMSVGAVYVARSRVQARLKRQVDQVRCD